MIQRHNEIGDTFGDLSALVWGQVSKEPIVKESDAKTNSPALIADLAGTEEFGHPRLRCCLTFK